MTATTVTSETLADFNAQAMDLGPLEAEAKPEKPAEEPKPEHEEEPGKNKAKIQGRFSEMTQARKAAEQRADAAERALAELKAEKVKEAPAKPDEPAKKPVASDYADAFEYAEALADWSVQKTLRERDAADEKKKADIEHAKVRDKWNERVKAAKESLSDYEEMLASAENISVSDDVKDSIIESEYGPQILYLLASEPDIADKLNAMGPRAQMREVGRLEAKFEKEAAKEPEAKEEPEEPAPPKVKERPKAPPPITPVRGTKVADNPLDEAEFKGSFKEYKAARLKQTA